MAYFSFSSPLGDLTLFEENDHLIALESGRVDGSEATALLLSARQQLDDYFDGQLTAFSLPLAPHGTAFQKKVWAAMSRIPFGKTATYRSIALEIGSAPRAVGGACGRNPLPILIPCHRVLAANGSLGGYSGFNGPDSKQFLLSLEARASV
jgi:methylated-DNA-[protein]-cysteine S-methyltransferase